jgi:hypothetical protein
MRSIAAVGSCWLCGHIARWLERDNLSGGQPVLIVRPVPVIKYRVQCRQVRRVWTQPSVNVFTLYGNNAAVVSSSGGLRRWLVGDGSTLPSAASKSHRL